MKKLTLINGGAIACLILMYLLMVQGCRKDRISPPSLENPQLIKKEVLTKWLETNKTAKLFSFDWRKARQAVIQGKNVLRVPILNIDKISSLKEKEGNTNTTPHLNNNHFNEHPPEVFFVQGGDKDALHPFMLNFIPTDKNNEFGENDVWTGKLYEWDLNGDSLFVQEYEKGKLKDQYGLKPKISAAEKDLNLVVKNNSLQSLKGVKDKKVGSVWTWLGSAFNNVWQAINWLGYYLGIPGAWINDPYGTGIIIRTWDIHSVFGEPPSMDYYDDYAGTSVYVAAGTPIYNSYVTPVGGPRIEYNPVQYDYPLRDDEIITLNDKVLTAVGLVYYDEPNLFQFYTETSQGVSMQEMLKSYLDTNGWTDENKEYAKGILRYLSDNRNAVDFEDFRSKLLNTYSDAEMLDIINTMQDPITGNGIELYLILNYRGSKLLNLSYNSSSNTIEVGSYTLRPHFDRNGGLLFYAAARLSNGGSKNGIEYIIRADQLNAFRTSVEYYTGVADWFYLNGIPSANMIKYAAGKSASERVSALGSLWVSALKSPSYWAYLGTTLLYSATLIGEASAIAEAKIGISSSEYTFTKTAEGHLTEVVTKGLNKGQLTRPYMDSPLTVQEIMATGPGTPDATYLGGLNWRVSGTFRGSNGTWELGINPQTKVIYHFNFTN